MLNTNDIESISTSVCRDMLGLDLESTANHPQDVLKMCASIRISGDYDAIVEIATSAQAASLVTGAMCCLQPEEIQESDVADALGEIANIIGGNIKGAIAGETKLSFPCVTLIEQTATQLPNTQSVTANFLLSNNPFQVRLLHSFDL